MNNSQIKSRFPLKIFTTSIIFILCISCTSGYGQQKKIANPNSTLATIKFQPPPPPPPIVGEPGDRGQGGAGRGCDPIALVPLTKTNNGNLLWGLTVAERPQFWFSLPRNLTVNDAIEFTLKDDQEQEVYKSRLEGINTPKGIVSFALPQQSPPLQIGKTYTWSFSVQCDFKIIEDRPGNVTGNIKRVPISTNLKNQLAKAKTPIEIASIYAQNGVWFDALDILTVNLRDKKEKDIISTWTLLLKQVNLEQIVNLPVTNCCTKSTTSN